MSLSQWRRSRQGKRAAWAGLWASFSGLLALSCHGGQIPECPAIVCLLLSVSRWLKTSRRWPKAFTFVRSVASIAEM
ncbi:hypothetical protein V8C42DRAFT_316290 [Trichoderma barbatum]